MAGSKFETVSFFSKTGSAMSQFEEIPSPGRGFQGSVQEIASCL